MLESASRLKLCLLCNSRTPTAEMLLHSPPLPLLIVIDFDAFKTAQSQENVLLALQHSDRVFSILAKRLSSELSMALNRTFPTLESLSLLSLDHRPLILPDNFVAPHLRSVSLYNSAIIVVSSTLINSPNIISLNLEGIEPPNYLSPENLVECISNMPQLENLSIKFDLLFPLSSTKTESWLTQTTPVVLPCLWMFTFLGDSAYLDNLLALISTPLLQCFCIRFLPQVTFALQSLPGFFRTIKNLDFRVVVVTMVSFLGTVRITYQPRQPSSFLSSFMFSIDNDIDQLTQEVVAQEIAAIAQICIATSPALRVVEDLAIESYGNYVSDDSAVRRKLWHTFLLSFGTLRTLRADLAFTRELSDVLDPHHRVATEELLPMLSELVVVSKLGLVPTTFSTFIHSRRFSGHPINLRTIKERPPHHES
jgi:hypothetical protein